MKRDIEKQFLEAYLTDGVVAMCIEVLQKRYDFDVLQKINQLPNTLKKDSYYYKTLPNRIREKAEAVLDNYANNLINISLIEEIRNNFLDYYTTPQEKKRYIHSLIIHFKGLNDFLHSTDARLEKIRERYEEMLQVSKYNLVEGDGTFIVDGTSTVEEFLSLFIEMAQRFANQLDALLLRNGIDFMQLQKDCEISLIKDRDITDIAYEKEIGSIELTKKYISELPDGNQPEEKATSIGNNNDAVLPQYDSIKNQNEAKVKPPQLIDSEELKPYFKAAFQGSGHNINSFVAFIEDLKTDRSAKEFAQIALMCFEGGQMTNRKHAAFQKWYRFFCKCAGREWKKSYDNMNTLRNSTKKELKTLFGYLQ